MPCEVEFEDDTQCPYMSCCGLKEVLDQNDANGLINIGLNMASISRYQNLNTSVEQHFYPSSLSFEMTCLLNNGFVFVSNLGLQRKVLMELQQSGLIASVDRIHQLCLLAGLISKEPDFELCANEGEANRWQLLDVALENHLVSLLTSCVDQWSDGKK